MTVYEARHAGREYCNDTEGSDHYKNGGVEPLDLMIAKGLAEDFCIGNMSKYAFRFKKTRNLEDLKKVSDYAHILCGVELGKTATPAPAEDKPSEYEWISVKDRLPERYVPCLIYSPLWEFFCVALRRDDDEFTNGVACVTPTHWQPLPEPPKENL